jgi:hypothetical protein
MPIVNIKVIFSCVSHLEHFSKFKRYAPFLNLYSLSCLRHGETECVKLIVSFKELYFTIVASERCLSFHYYMFGHSVDSLSVYVSGENRPRSLVWSESGNQGSIWKFAKVNIDKMEKLKVTRFLWSQMMVSIVETWPSVLQNDSNLPAKLNFIGSFIIIKILFILSTKLLHIVKSPQTSTERCCKQFSFYNIFLLQYCW